MKLYHGSEERIKDLEIKNNDLFCGMFFSSDYDAARGHGKFMYTVDVDDDNIIDSHSFPWDDDVYDFAVERYGNLASDILDYVAGEKNEYRAEIDELLLISKKLLGYEINDDLYELSFALQKEAAIIADHIGYKAVAVDDEHGTSYIVMPGAVMREVSNE